MTAYSRKKEPKYPVYDASKDGCVYDWILEQSLLLKAQQKKKSPVNSKFFSSRPTDETSR